MSLCFRKEYNQFKHVFNSAPKKALQSYNNCEEIIIKNSNQSTNNPIDRLFP